MKRLFLLVLPLLILTGCQSSISVQKKIFCKQVGEEACAGDCESDGLASVYIGIDPLAERITLYGADIDAAKTYNVNIYKEHSIYRLNIIDKDFYENYDSWAMVLDPKSGNYTETKKITFKESELGPAIFVADGICQNGESLKIFE